MTLFTQVIQHCITGGIGIQLFFFHAFTDVRETSVIQHAFLSFGLSLFFSYTTASYLCVLSYYYLFPVVEHKQSDGEHGVHSTIQHARVQTYSAPLPSNMRWPLGCSSIELCRFIAALSQRVILLASSAQKVPNTTVYTYKVCVCVCCAVLCCVCVLCMCDAPFSSCCCENKQVKEQTKYNAGKGVEHFCVRARIATLTQFSQP